MFLWINVEILNRFSSPAESINRFLEEEKSIFSEPYSKFNFFAENREGVGEKRNLFQKQDLFKLRYRLPPQMQLKGIETLDVKVGGDQIRQFWQR